MNDSRWLKLIEGLQDGLDRLEKATTTLRDAVARGIDSRQRARLTRIANDAKSGPLASVHSILSRMENMARTNAAVRASAVRVTRDAQIYVDAFQDAFRQFQRALPESVLRAVQREGLESDSDVEVGESVGLLAAERGARAAFEAEMEEENLRERSAALKKVAEDVQDIHEIFTHMNELVGEQGERLEDMEDGVNQAAERIRQGAECLQSAAQQGNRSNRTLFIAVGCLAAVILLILLLVVSKGEKKK